jgi:hypothetical protein
MHEQKKSGVRRPFGAGSILFMVVTFSISLLLSCGSQNSAPETRIEDDGLSVEKKRLELERERLELEREKIRNEKEKVMERAQNDKLREVSRKAQSFYSSPEAIVTSERAYFHSNPDYNTRKKAYLVRGDLTTALKVSNNFIYVEFYSEYLKKTTSGWIDVNDVDHY